MSDRPIVFDVTHLISRQGVRTPTGIDRVDHAYAAEFARHGGLACGVQCLFSRPRTLSAPRVGHYADMIERDWREDTDAEDDPLYHSWRGFVTAERITVPPLASATTASKPTLLQRWALAFRVGAGMLAHEPEAQVPRGALYLNVAQSPVLTPRSARFLARRPDLKAVFLLHDLIPIDFPEYFPNGRKAQFEAVLAAMYQHAAALITTSEAVRSRLAEDMRAKGVAQRPIHVAPLPVPPGFDRAITRDPRLAATRYVVMVGTVEPRKNHRMLLQLWRQMVRQGDEPPRLVIVGAKGWENEAVNQMLTRTPELARHVLHLAGLSNEGLRRVISYARALLMPSFSEGYGIPVIEGAALGTPVIASDLPVFAEVSQGCARLVDPLDGPGWRRAILDLAGPQSLSRASAPQPLDGFTVPTSSAYFSSIRSFLSAI